MIISNREFKPCDDCMSRIICHVQSVRWYEEEFDAIVF